MIVVDPVVLADFLAFETLAFLAIAVSKRGALWIKKRLPLRRVVGEAGIGVRVELAHFVEH